MWRQVDRIPTVTARIVAGVGVALSFGVLAHAGLSSTPRLDTAPSADGTPSPAPPAFAAPGPASTPLPVASPVTFQTPEGLRYADEETYERDLADAITMDQAAGVLGGFLRQYGVRLWTTAGSIDPATDPATTWTDLSPADPTDLADLKTFGSWFIDEWSKYPPSWLEVTKLRTVAMVKDLATDGAAEWGEATYGVMFVQVTPLSALRGAAEAYLREIVQHEFGHEVEYGTHGSPDRPDDGWSAFNPAGFRYGATSGNAEHPAPGFVTAYAETSIGEDKAETYAYMFVDADSKLLAGWERSDPDLADKVAYYRSFIESKVTVMNDAYFKAIDP